MSKTLYPMMPAIESSASVCRNRHDMINMRPYDQHVAEKNIRLVKVNDDISSSSSRKNIQKSENKRTALVAGV